MLSLVIPCYNEKGNLPAIIQRLETMRGADIEAILVDNGSTDGSDAELARLLQGHAFIRSIRVPVNRGYGYGILQGLDAARGDVLGWTHADMQTDPADALRCHDLLRLTTAPAIVKGRRRNRAMLDACFTYGMQLVAWCALGVKLDDINAQPKIFPRGFYVQYVKAGAPHDFSLDLFLLVGAKKAGFTVLTVPVDFAKRQAGEAKGGGSFKTRLKLVRRTFAYIFELRKKLRKTF